jgi:hypothetical protein
MATTRLISFSGDQILAAFGVRLVFVGLEKDAPILDYREASNEA